jgi:hypothetical protein
VTSPTRPSASGEVATLQRVASKNARRVSFSKKHHVKTTDGPRSVKSAKDDEKIRAGPLVVSGGMSIKQQESRLHTLHR